MEEKYFKYFQEKLKKVPELRAYQSCLDNPEFDKWWGSILATCDRMGPAYKKRADNISFFPGVLTSGDDSAHINKRYQSGLREAEGFIENVMDELQTWGLDTPANSIESDTANINDKPFNFFLTVSQQQAQQIIQTINLEDYDDETKRQVNDLFQELNRKEKNKEKIKDIVKWLADKSIDALIAILIAKTNLV